VTLKLFLTEMLNMNIKMTNTTIDDIIKALELFNEKTEKLNRLSFIKTVLEHNTGVTISFNKKEDGSWEITQERRGPLEEAIDAFVLTFRFFIQDNEKSSFRNLNDYYNEPAIDESLRKEFQTIRNKINRFLEGNSGMALNYNNETLNHRKIMDLMVYGALSHANPEKKKMYDALSHTPMKALFDDNFVTTLTIIHKAINAIKNLNYRAIANLGVK